MAVRRGGDSLKLIELLTDSRAVQTAAVLAAFTAVPRHLFVPHVPPKEAYTDQSVWVYRADGSIATVASQPTAVAHTLELLAAEPGQTVLEIGAGTGYNAALLSHIVGPSGHVTTLDIDAELTRQASAILASLGLGPKLIEVVCADGASGHAPRAPYDRIVLTVGTDDFSAAWWEQLRPGGRLVLPIAVRGTDQLMVAFEHRGDHLESLYVGAADYMWLQGAQAVDQGVAVPFPGTDCGIRCETAAPDLAQNLATLLARPTDAVSTGVEVVRSAFWWKLARWLALRAPDYCTIRASGPSCARGMVPRYSLEEWDGFAFATIGLLNKAGLALLEPLPQLHPPALGQTSWNRSNWLFGVRSRSGSSRTTVQLVTDWAASGRPSTEGVRVRAYPHDDRAVQFNGTDRVIRKSGADLVVDWPEAASAE